MTAHNSMRPQEIAHLSPMSLSWSFLKLSPLQTIKTNYYSLSCFLQANCMKYIPERLHPWLSFSTYWVLTPKGDYGDLPRPIKSCVSGPGTGLEKPSSLGHYLTTPHLQMYTVFLETYHLPVIHLFLTKWPDNAFKVGSTRISQAFLNWLATTTGEDLLHVPAQTRRSQEPLKTQATSWHRVPYPRSCREYASPFHLHLKSTCLLHK